MSSHFTHVRRPRAPPGPPLIGALLRRPLQVVRARMLERLHGHGFDDLEAAHLAVLQYPGPQGLRPSELAARVGMSKQAVNYQLGQLERLGYLVREPDPGDQRSQADRPDRAGLRRHPRDSRRRRRGRGGVVARARRREIRSAPRAPRRAQRAPHRQAGRARSGCRTGRRGRSGFLRATTMSLRKPMPVARSRSTSAPMSSTWKWRRFQPPGSGRRPSGMGRRGRALGPRGAAAGCRVAPRRQPATCRSQSKPRCRV